MVQVVFMSIDLSMDLPVVPPPQIFKRKVQNKHHLDENLIIHAPSKQAQNENTYRPFPAPRQARKVSSLNVSCTSKPNSLEIKQRENDHACLLHRRHIMKILLEDELRPQSYSKDRTDQWLQLEHLFLEDYD